MKESLRGEMKATFGAAKSWWRWVLVLWVVSLGVAMAPHLVGSPASDHVCVVLATLVALGSFGARWKAEAAYQTAEGIRRMLLIIDALPGSPDSAELTELRTRASTKPDSDPDPIGAYFTSTTEQGWVRLLENVEESAFYTAAQAARTAALCATGVAFVLGVCGSILYWGAAWQATDAPLVADAALTAVGTVIAGGLTDLTRGYFNLARRAGRTHRRASHLLAHRGQQSEGNVLEVVAGYDAALAAATPLPGFVYNWMRARLEQLWADRRAARRSADPVRTDPPVPGSR